MNYWIFQSVVEQYDLRRTLREGTTESWRASRYRQEMSPGDFVFFWLGGPDNFRGIYGWGTLLSTPYPDKNNGEFGVRVRYDRRLKKYVSIMRIRQLDELKDVLILRAPQATNFILSKDEARAIASLMDPGERPQI